MPQTLQITRTGTDGNSPISGSLAPGQLAIEMGTPTKLWVGVPAANAPALQKLIYDSSAAGGVTIADTPPANATPGQLWWESDSGSTFIWYDDGTSAQWVQIDGGDVKYVQKSGDVMTGPLLIDSFDAVSLSASKEISAGTIRTTGNAYIEGSQLSVGKIGTASTAVVISGTITSERQLIFQTDTYNRWRIMVDSFNSDFAIAYHNDAGLLVGLALTISRATGIVNFAVRPTVAGVPIAAALGLPDILDRLAALEAAQPK